MQQTFGEFITEKRDQLGHKRIYVANKLGVSATYVRDLEKGNRPAPHSELLLRLLSILDIDRESSEFFYALDLAAETRCDVPLDIKTFLILNQDIFYKLLRKMNDGSISSDDIEVLKNSKFNRYDR